MEVVLRPPSHWEPWTAARTALSHVPGQLLYHVTLLTSLSHHRDLEAQVQRKQDMSKGLAVEEGDAPCSEPDLHIKDLRASLGTVSCSAPWKGQGGWAGAPQRKGSPGKGQFWGHWGVGRAPALPCTDP